MNIYSKILTQKTINRVKIKATDCDALIKEIATYFQTLMDTSFIIENEFKVLKLSNNIKNIINDIKKATKKYSKDCPINDDDILIWEMKMIFDLIE